MKYAGIAMTGINEVILDGKYREQRAFMLCKNVESINWFEL